MMRLSPSVTLLRAQSDARLVALAREGHEPAFTALVERYRRQVGVACRRILPDSRAEDATQQVFVAAWRALERGDEVRDVRPWLLRIARNTSLNALRVSGYDYDELAGSLAGGEAPQAELERRDVMRQTLAGLAALPDNQREALLRSAVGGASHADIARDLGITEGATRQLVLRARTTLRSAVTAVTPMPLIQWAVRSGASGDEVSARIVETAAGGGAAGAGALLAKVGVFAVVAGGAATPVIVHHQQHRPVRPAAIEQTAAETGKTATVADERTPVPTVTVVPVHHEATGTSTSKSEPHGPAHRPSGSRHRGGGDDGPSHSSGPGPSSGDDSGSSGSSGQSTSGGSGSDDSSGSGVSSGTQNSGSSNGGSGSSPGSGSGTSNSSNSSGKGSGGSSGSSGSGSSGNSGSGSSGSGGDDATPVPIVTAVPTQSSGSGGGGSGDSGSGSSGSSGQGGGGSSTPVPTIGVPTSTAMSGSGDSGHGGGGHGGSDDDD